MKQLLKEPLLHFLFLGAALFAAFGLLESRSDTPRDNQIIVTAGTVEHLASVFTRTWQRPPTAPELDAIIQEHVRDEIAYREGLAVGLDRDDTVIRRRIRQKLEFLAEDLLDEARPGPSELEAFLYAHPEQFRSPDQFSFRQVFLDVERRGDAWGADAADLLAALDGDPSIDARMLGDRTLLDHAYAAVTPRDIESIFGADFAAALEQMTPGAWSGPIASAYGVHLVRIDERLEGETLPLSAVHDDVLRAWEHERRDEALAEFYQKLRNAYDIVIEWPQRIEQGATP